MAKEKKKDEEEDGPEKDEKEPKEGEEGGEGEGKEKKPKFKLGAGVINILKQVLMYLGVAIIAFGVSFLVSKMNAGGGGGDHGAAKGGAHGESLVETDPHTGDVIERVPKGGDWDVGEIIVNTADEDERHIARIHLIVSYDKENKFIVGELNDRKSQIYSELRGILGSKRYDEIATTPRQLEVVREVKAKVQQIVGIEGVLAVFIKEFTVH